MDKECLGDYGIPGEHDGEPICHEGREGIMAYTETCQDCKYYYWMQPDPDLPKVGELRYCRRYPQPYCKKPSDWCGEFEHARGSRRLPGSL
jgi:hypothetical protein